MVSYEALAAPERTMNMKTPSSGNRLRSCRYTSRTRRFNRLRLTAPPQRWPTATIIFLPCRPFRGARYRITSSGLSATLPSCATLCTHSLPRNRSRRRSAYTDSHGQPTAPLAATTFQYIASLPGAHAGPVTVGRLSFSSAWLVRSLHGGSPFLLPRTEPRGRSRPVGGFADGASNVQDLEVYPFLWRFVKVKACGGAVASPWSLDPSTP
jgi:hypothetical protein